MKASLTTCNLAADEKAGSQDACAAELWRENVIAVLADGVGGARYAAEAATRTVENIVTNFKSRPKSWGVARALEEFTRLINRTLHQESLGKHGRPEMLCTVAAVAVEAGQLYGVNAGDSRVYLWHEGNLRLLSEDHVETEKNLKHVLRRAIGMEAEIALHTFQATVAPRDLVLLCSDGLSNVLPAEEMERLCRHRASARTFAASARERATPETMDDTSVAVLEIIDPGDARQLTLEVPGALHAGQIFDGCELLRPLNPTERAWIARRDGGEVVIKFAPERAGEDEAVHNQFAREIWSVTRFEADFFIHAFVPPDTRTFCYCMEYVPAPTLKEELKRRAFTVPETTALAGFLLAASQFFAVHDLVHGDLKPENILVLRDGEKIRFKLIDFGSVTGFFSISTRAGTPSFLAPERFRSVPISERTEIFSIGVTLFLAVTGRFPYGEIEPFQTPQFHAPPRPTALNPLVPPWLEALLLRAVAIAPDERYQTYSEMKFDLENPAQVRPWFRKDTPLLERNPLLFYKIGFFVLLITCLVLLARLSQKH